MKLAELVQEVEELKTRIEQVDRQSRCTHVWEPDREDPRIWLCSRCGCEDLRRH